MHRNILKIIVLGSVWGTLEATLGALLHYLNFPLKGNIMASVGFFCLYLAIAGGRGSNKIYICTAVGAVAAAVKLFDLLLPMPAIYTIRPAVAILIEALAFSAAVSFMAAVNRDVKPGYFTFSLLVQTLYAIALACVFKFGGIGSGMWKYYGVNMLIRDIAINTVICFGLLSLRGPFAKKMPAFSLTAKNAAAVLFIVLSMRSISIMLG